VAFAGSLEKDSRAILLKVSLPYQPWEAQRSIRERERERERERKKERKKEEMS